MAISSQAVRKSARYFGTVCGELTNGQGLQRLILKQVRTGILQFQLM